MSKGDSGKESSPLAVQSEHIATDVFLHKHDDEWWWNLHFPIQSRILEALAHGVNGSDWEPSQT